MKKTYLLIVDLFLNNSKIFLSQGFTSDTDKFSESSINGNENGSMKTVNTPVLLKLILVLMTGLLSTVSYSQTFKPFAIRKNIDVRGGMAVAGNNILGFNSLPYNVNTTANQNISMQYIDIDGDASTFNSSSAELIVPNQKNGTPSTCYRVAYAALYWGAMLQSGSRSDINKVKLKLPGATTYNDITGVQIYDAIAAPIVPDNNAPYACYADVTSLLTALPTMAGNYTVANVVSSTGLNGTTGLSAGWTLYVVYEDPTLQMKSFTSFDGFASLYDGRTQTIPVTGFRTPLSGNIDLQLAYAALDGDKPQGGTKLEIEGKEVTTTLRSNNKFFSSTIENTDGVSTPRNPSGTNTLGYDTGMLEVKAAQPEYIGNNQSSTDFTLQVARGQADPVFVFFSAYAVDIIAPKIDLTKLVKNTSGVEIGGGNVNLGQSLTYEISYQSVGNDNVRNFTIKDVLPENIVFNPATDIDYTNAGGATLQSYNALTRTLIFNIPATSVLANSASIYKIRLNIRVVPSCNDLSNACSNLIMNQAFATYTGTINTNIFQEEGSFASTACRLGSPQSTNFLVDISNCKFTQNVILCTTSVVLKASDGYTNYSWSRSPDGSNPIHVGQTYTATQTGIYYVRNTAPSGCKDIVEEITVSNFGTTNTNPVIPYAQLPYAGEVVTCPNDGKQLPNLFLCGLNDSRVIRTGISDATSIEWYKLNEASCTAVTNPNCANESTSCTWTLVGTGADYTANTSGQFRLTIKYPGGCFSQFYFNVYQNLLNPTVTSKDNLCTTKGQITVRDVPSGYEYSLVEAGPYQLSNVFNNVSAGSYTAYIRQIGVVNACIFKVPVTIRNRTFAISANVIDPICNGDLGTIQVATTDGLPQYSFTISQGATVVASSGLTMDDKYEFKDLNPGTYTVRVTTDDGCDRSINVDVIAPALLTATASVTTPLTCADGVITIVPTGGTAPYRYSVNTVFQTSNLINVVKNALPPGGVYNIIVEDSKNCKANTSVTVAAILPPVYTVSKTADITCYNGTAAINFTVTNANGNTLAYSIDNGVTYLPTSTFSSLAAGTYNTIVRYTYGTSVCYGTMQPITITQPSTALTASAGVSELAGCGPAGEGKVRITNPQGGTPFPAPNLYLYSFDNQATWVTTNEAYMMPGTYTLYIKDALGCIFQMPGITIDPKPVAPTINVANPAFNCDGTANSTVTVTNPNNISFTYNYYLDGTLNPNTSDPKTFLNVGTGSHTISVEYKLQSVSTYSNLLKEDFGSGPDVQSPGINPAFCWERQVEATKCNNNKLFGNGEYTVTNSLLNNPYSGWHNPVDHTAGSATGRYLAVDAGTAIPNNAVLYRKTIKDIIPNQPIQVRFFGTNLLKVGNTQPDASLTVELQNSSGVALSSSSTGGIPKTNGWVQFDRTINPGNNTTLDFVLRLEVAQVNGIDFAVDDIQVYQLPKICVTKVDFPFEVPSGKAFDASVSGFKNVSCAGANNGTITIAAQNFDPAKGFQYSINGGTNWYTVMTSPYTITSTNGTVGTGLAAANYTVLMRYDAASTGTCVKTVLQPITTPTAVTVTASVTTQPTCTTGATITAVGAGGTPAYLYELRTSAGVVRDAFQTSAEFTNIPVGNYMVFAKDANSCVTTAGAAVSVLAPPTLTATLATSSDFCYDTVNQASLVVNVSGGKPTFSYRLDGGLAQNSNTFTNVGVGTHSIVVTDSNNCTATISNITIAPQLQLTATLAQDLTCLVNASITSTIAGGYGGTYTYAGTLNGTALSPAPSFPFTASLPGTYVFTVTDSKGCIATSNAITVTPKTTPTLTFIKTDISCNNANDGTITITAAAGIAPYQYSINNGTSFQASNQFTGLVAGTYNVKVKDSKDCESAVSNVTIVNPAVVTGNISATNILCSATGTVPAVVTVTGSGGTPPFKYSFNGTSASSFTTTNTFSTTTAGTVTAYIQDANGCQIGPLSVTIGALQPITNITITDSGYDCSTTPAGGHVTLAAVKAGTANLTNYQIISGPAGYNTAINTSGDFTSLAAGNYIFQATDTKTNCTFTKPYTVSGTPDIVAGGNVTAAIKCFGGTGTIQFTVNGVKNSGYNYVIRNAANTTVQFGNGISQTITTVAVTAPQPAGVYTITATDIKTQCIATYSVTLTQPAAALAVSSAIPTHVNCNNDNSQITVTASGGTPNYTYAAVISGSAVPSTYSSSNVITVDTNSAANLVWDVYVKDANGCTTAAFPVTVISDPTPTVTASVTNQCSASGSSFTITATGTGGIGTLMYGINGATGAYQLGNSFTVAPGTYTVWVKDGNGCAASTATPITVYPQLVASAAVTKTLDCSTSPDAVITTTITGGKAPYTYTVKKDSETPTSGGSASPALTFTRSVTNANAGTYTFVVTDANNCTSTTTVIVSPITNPTVTETHVNPLCNGNANGTVQLTGAGGSGGYSYSKDGSTFVATSLFTGLAAGAYTFYVKDNKGCIGTVPVTLNNPTTVGASAVITTPFSCSATNTKVAAVITVTGSGGSGTYTYSFDNGVSFSSINSKTVNDNGSTQSFDIIVKDANGCLSSVQHVDLAPLNPPTISSIVGTPIYCAPLAATTSEVTVTRTPGKGVNPLTYTIVSGPVTNTTGATSGKFTGLTDGTYMFKVTDANGCFAIQSHTVPVVTKITVLTNKLADVDCFGNTTGSINYKVSGFTSTYSYSVNGATAVTGRTAATFDLPNLGATTYNVVFTDETTLCTASTSVIITQPAVALSATVAKVNANCFVPTSKVTVTPAGGTASYTYAYMQDGVAPAIPTDYVANNVANLNPTTNANWDVWVKDAKGCTYKVDVAITKDPTPTVTASAVGQCLGVGSYTITANGTGGVGTLTYSINGGGSYQALNTFVVTTPGSYIIRVKDANGCTFDSTPVVVAPQLTLSAVLNKGITCNPAPTAAQITLTPTGGVGSFTYTASPNTGSFSGNVFTTSAAGNYIFTVTDTTTGCTYTTTTPIVTTIPVNPDITGVTQTAFIDCNGDDTAAIAIAINNALGQAPFVFNVKQYSNVAHTSLVKDFLTQTSGLPAGYYVITLTDAKGCTDTQNITITEPTPITFTRSITPITCNSTTGISLGSITINSVSGGSPNYIYHVTGVNGYDTKFTNQTGLSAVFDVVDFGLYQIIITDANGCTAFENDILIVSPPDDLDISITAPPANCSAPGSAEIAVGGTGSSVTGPGPYHFAVYSPGLTYTGATALPWYDEDVLGSKKTTIPNLLPGVTYTFIVHDGLTGCYYFETSSTAIPTSSTMAINPLTANNITCKGNADGSVTFTINHIYGAATPVTYQVYNAQSVTPIGSAVAAIIPASGSLTVSNFGVLPFGNYFVLVTETAGASHAGCSMTSAPFNITESAIDLSVAASITKNVNCNPNSGIIAAQAQNGTAPYTYQYLLSSVTAPTAVSGGWIANTTFATSVTGNYIVYVKDAYGCIKTAPVTLDADTAPTVTAPLAPICYDGSTPFTITISGTVDPDIIGGATYSVNGSAFQTSPSFTFNAAGTYRLYIQDGNGCTAYVDYEVYPKLNLSATLAKELDCTVTPNATITLTTTGGDTTPTASYTYEVDKGIGFGPAVNPYTATTPGTYVFRVTDANNATACQTTTTFVLDPITPTVFTTTPTHVSCNGGNDGTITVNVTSGVGPYQYQLDGGAFQTSNTFTGLFAGTTYVVTVRDSKSCLYPSAAITITEPVLLAATSTLTTPLTCGTGNVAQLATVTVTATAGTGTAPYQYSFNLGVNYSDTNTYQSYVGTTFDVYVKDAKGCIYILTDGVNIPALNAPTDMTITGTPVLCSPVANTTSSITISGVVNGVGPLSYTILPSIPAGVTQQASPLHNKFDGLLPGTYLFQVTDANGCKYQESYTVAPVTNITVGVQLVKDVTCNESPAVPNGAVTFAVDNAKVAGAFTYTLLQGSGGTIAKTTNAVTLTGLGAGTYEIEVTDSTTGCKATVSAVVSQPATALSLTEVSNVNANCNSGAKVTVAANGGTPNYTYAFVANNATPLATDYTASASRELAFTAPGPNNWDVWVKDNNGCTSKLDIVTNVDALPTIVLPTPQCFVGTPLTINLSLPAVTTVPVGPVKYYTINGSNQTSPIYTITAPGTYQLSVVDANGCTSNTVNYVVQPQLILNATLTQDLTCASDASITLVATGGTGTYNAFQVDINGGGFNSIVGSSYTATTAGTYTFRVSDNQVPSCPATSSAITVTPKTTPTATFTQTNVSCIGGSDGTIEIFAAGGIPPYQYSINNGGTFQSSNFFTGLNDAGVYNIVVKDAKACITDPLVPLPVDITEPTQVTASHLVTPFGCNSANAPLDAIVTITANFGTPGYTYSFDGGTTFQTSPSFTVNTPQTISYVVHDANGCSSVIGLAPVLLYTPPTEMDLTASPIYCNTPGTVATVTVNAVTGGVGSYTYEIISPATAVTAPSLPSLPPFDFVNLAPDTYTIKVTDANGCSTTKSIIVEEADKISVTASLVNNVFCNGGTTGAVNFIVSNYITAGSYGFSLTPTPPTAAFTQAGDVISYTGLPAGSYTFDVRDTVSGCVASVANFTISQPALALGSTSIATNINCNNDNATVTINATVGTGTAPYRYAIARASETVPTIFGTNNQFVVDTNNGVDMNWVAYVKDNNGCVTNNSQPILIDANPTISSAVATQCPSTTGTYNITVTATGFSTALSYSVDGTSFQTSNIITVNAPGNYNVTVKDANGCLSTATPVTILQPLTLAGSITVIPTCNDANAEVTLVATGGTSSYEYSRNGVTYGPIAVFGGLTPNATPYKFYVKDANCVKSIDFTIEPATIITGFALTPTPVSCNGGTDGKITATMIAPAPGVNDNPVYMYTLSGTETRPAQSSPIFSGLQAGSYTVDVVSGRGCKASLPTTVTEPNPIDVPMPIVSEFGCTLGSNTMNYATISVTGVTGGSGTYLNYEFIKGGTRVQFGPSNTYTEANLLGGSSYTVKVYDSNSCEGTSVSVPIAAYIALDKIDVKVAPGKAITCASLEEIIVTAITIGGTPANLEYTLVDVNATTGVQGGVYPSQTQINNGVFTGLTVANYMITVKNLDTGCSIKGVHYVNEPNTFELKAVKTSDTCYGLKGGAVTVNLIDLQPTPTNDAGVFTYTVTGPEPSTGTSDAAGQLNLSGLSAGVYTISAISGSTSCPVQTTFTIDQPTENWLVSETHTPITCALGDGTISMSVTTGGWPGGYEFQLELGSTIRNPWSSVSSFTGLSQGNYTVRVRDSKGCEPLTATTVNLVNPQPIANTTIVADKPTLSCFGDTDATISFTQLVTGGSGVYNYTLETTYPNGTVTLNGPQQSSVFTNLGAASYKVFVSDAWSCTGVSNTFVINQPTVVKANLVMASAATCTAQATLTLSATGGTAPYSYSNTSSFASVLGTFATSSAPISVAPGTHRYYVKDANGCVSFVSNDVKIDPVPTLVLNRVSATAFINCKDDRTGVIVVRATGGLGNYVYALSDNITNLSVPGVLQTTPGNFTNLPAGTYKVSVVSADCNAPVQVVTITEPTRALEANPIPTNVTCNGLNNGKIVVTAQYGTGPYKYAISPNLNQFFVTGVFENLAPGDYEIIAQDQNGCYVYTKAIKITQPARVVGSLDASIPVIQEECYGDKNAAFSITVSGGTRPYTVHVDNGTDITGTASQTLFNFTGLAGGVHKVYVKDANGCDGDDFDVPLDEAIKLNPQAYLSYDCASNTPGNTITVAIDPSADANFVEYALDGVGTYQRSGVFADIAPGIHYIAVRYANGSRICEKQTQKFPIDKIDPLTLEVKDGLLNEIVANVKGGTGKYQFTFNGEAMGDNNKFVAYKSGNYTIRVTDENGCYRDAQKYFEFIDIEIPNVFTPNSDGNNDGWGPRRTENYPDLVFFVFDRYGRKVGTYRQGDFWDGKYEGKELPTGDYWYVLKLRNDKDSREFVGHFTLYR